MTLAAASAALTMRSGHQAGVLLTLALSTLGITFTADLFGPLFLMPMFAAANCMNFALVVSREWRLAPYIAGVLALAIPLGLQLGGLWPSSYSYVEGGMVILDNALVLGADTTVVVLTLLNLVTLFSAVTSTSFARAALRRTERRLFMQSWHLRQLIPTPGGKVQPGFDLRAPRLRK